MAEILTKVEVYETYQSPSWQSVVFAEFESTLTSKSRPFPCVFGVSGLKRDQLRYAFLDPLTPEVLAPLLKEYVRNARSFGRHTSLVVFARPGPVQNLENYRDRFWDLLDGLECIDDVERPADIPRELESDHWEFCFAGEPIFVVCNSPAHILRQRRRSTSYMVTFQPRWVFEDITDSQEPAALKALETVRERLAAFDAIAPAPHLGSYGAAGNREYQKYFIDDTNDVPRCPFARLGEDKSKDDLQKGKVA